MAQEVAVEILAGVAGVVDPGQTVFARIGFQRVARVVEQRTPEPARFEPAPRPHRAQAFGARAAQRAQQEGFGLVVAMVGEGERLSRHHRLRESRVAGLSRGGFGAVASVATHLDAHDRQRQVPLCADVFAMRGPGIGLGLQAVVDVDGADVQAAFFGHARKGMQ